MAVIVFIILLVGKRGNYYKTRSVYREERNDDSKNREERDTVKEMK